MLRRSLKFWALPALPLTRRASMQPQKRPAISTQDQKPAMFQNIRADYRAYDGNWGAQGFWVMVVYRFGRWRYGVRPAILRKLFSLLYRILFKFVQIITGIELPCEVRIGRDFVIDHFGGIIISGYAQFGDHCRIRNGVVVGLRRVEEKFAPVIGNNVDIGAGAKLLGPIHIGNNVLIGANAVVLCDVPDDSIAAGVPARIMPRRVEQEPARPDT
jgi:serine O-acetyltransferase